MEMSMERDSSALGSLFQQIINDMKNTSPLWEDFVAKASKLHACLRAAIQAIAAYLDAFQKIADAATNSRGASKEIGTALTRVCLRHKAVETRLKTFTAAIMDCLVQPLQDKLEDWKRSVATIDKEHAKEYKRCRTELKKRSTDTLRLQKKARKGQSDTLQSLMDSHMQDVTLRRAELEEVEKKSLRSAMIEERMRYCSFVHMLQPVVKEECEVMSELGHLQEAMQSIALVTKEPQVLPAASEELIHDAKASITLYPESPSASAGGGGSLSQGGCSNSLGSRKSSVCSISSMNSSGSSNSPGHPHYPRSLSQLISPSIRLKPGESSDSGFCSSPALTTQASSINNPSHAVTTWPTHSQDTVDLPSNASERPHTISSAYEKGHQRPPLTVYTFQNPETIHEGVGGNNNTAAINNGTGGSSSGQNTPSTQKSPAGALTRPPLPVRCSSLERPLSANNSRGNGTNLMQRQCPSPIPAHVTKDSSGNVVENDERSRASVLQKASMFEKQAAAVKSTPTPPAIASSNLSRNSVAAAANIDNSTNAGIYGTRTSSQHQQQQQQQSQSIDPQEVDKCFEDSLQELNNLIGELDSFQREIDASKQHKEHHKNVKNLYDGIDSYISNETMTIITDDNTTTIICETTQQQHLQQTQQEKDFCTASNQTNSSGCGTDISDTTSEDCNADSRSLTSQTGMGGGGVVGGGCGGNGNELIGGLLKTNLKALSGGAFNSDSELSRCYISETSSITGGCAGDGYENPTFAHFAASSSASQCYDDNRSDTLSLQRQALYGDNMSDNGSNVVVIYDHQPPITPDIDYCKQNSEIVMLRTKPAQHSQYTQEMRELQQLPDNLTDTSSPTSPNGTSDHSMHQHIATVAPAKQRLSSFRASSEQLQLLNSSPTAAATTKAATIATPSSSSSASSASTTPSVNSCSSNSSETIIRKKLPPKPPSLTVFQGISTAQMEINNNSNNNSKSAKLLQTPPKLDFKSDLEAKILKQKEKLKKQQEIEQLQQQQQQKQLVTPISQQQKLQQQQQHHNINNSINCNSSTIINKTKSLETSQSSSSTSVTVSSTTSLSPTSSSSLASHSNNINSINSLNNNHNSSSPSLITTPNNHDSLKHTLNSHQPNSHIYSKTPLTAHAFKASSSSSCPQPALNSVSSSSASLNVVMPPLPPPLPSAINTNNTHHNNNNVGSMLCNTSPAPLLANVAKPSITPRPASLSGSTRIARRSSVNTAKPPPPVRRSSSVTPSPNTPTTPTNTNAINMLHQQAHSLNTSTENFPPPPAYLLDARQTTPTSPPSSIMPNSSQKVSETVKALSGLRHQPASPHTLRRLQQQQQQQQLQQQSMLQSPIHHQIYSPNITTPTSPITLPMHDEPEYDAYYNTYVEVQSFADNDKLITPTKNNANIALMLNNVNPNKIISPLYQQPPKQYQHQYTKSSPVLLSPPTIKRTTPTTPLTPLSSLQTDLDEIPPPLPPPNPNQSQTTHHHQHQLSLPLRYQQQLPTPGITAHSNNNHMPPQQLQHHHQQQQQQQQNQYQEQQPQDYNNGEAIYGTNSPTSFRTSSPGGGIYAQPKILNNMSSFRTNSPGPNGHQTPTQTHVPAQPKTNPNLIAQLNARLNSKQQNSNEAIYGVSSINHHQQREEIYMRNYQQQQMSPHLTQPPQQQTQQQQTYDAAENNANATFNTNQNQNQYSSQYYAPKNLTAAHHQQQQQQQQAHQHVQKVANATNMHPSRQSHQTMPMSQSPLPPQSEPIVQQSHYQTAHHPHHQQREPMHHASSVQHYTCPPPLEDPPPPPIHNSNNNSATMPKRANSSHHQHHQQQSHNLAAYAAASSAATLPKNMIQQQRLQQQQQHQQQGIYGTQQAQQQQYHAPAAITGAPQPAQQYQNPQHISQRPPMPLPHHQQQQQQQQQAQQQQQQQTSQQTTNRNKTATVNVKQPPVPSRHSSVQQKIFVATNPFIQTTTIHCHSPSATSSVHSQPASPICSSPTPSSVASIYGTSSRRSSGSGGGGAVLSHYDVGGGGGGGNAGQMYYNHQLNTASNTNYTSTNVDKTASIRSKAKAEFLENLNAKLAKQSLSGRAFAVRNLINSKALMYQNLQNLKRPSAQYRNLPLFDTNATSTPTIGDEAL
ncbi:mucin-4 isoform X19 [Lucilia cuprina]|uniref:mucin-4 isoform X19 n=1 Tax=Lucilia cuprina TaxID=7375 RepID=UPI001F053D72|nr:mucin-4 isoform X19 [Lucilia cuprina]